MSEPTTKTPVPVRQQDQKHPLDQPLQLFGGPQCQVPPEFEVDASSLDDPANMAAPMCEEGQTDALYDGIAKASENADNGWARGRLNLVESHLLPMRNIVSGLETGMTPPEGSIHHYGTYADWEIDKSQKKGLKKLFEAMWVETDAKKRLRLLRDGQKAFGEALKQVRAFNSKKWTAKEGFTEMIDAVEKEINAPLKQLKASIEATIPYSERKTKKGAGSTKGSKGFNKTKIEDLTQLPGLAAPTGPEPEAGSLAAQVEANMARDISVSHGSVEDLLYVNIPDLVAGKGKNKKAKAAWKMIRRYRNNTLNPIFEKYSKDPTNPELKAQYEAALKQMEVDIGKDVRDTLKGMWADNSVDFSAIKGEADGLHTQLADQHKTLAEAKAGEGFDPGTLDHAGLREFALGARARVMSIRTAVGSLPTSKAKKNEILNPTWTAYKDLGSAAGTFKRKQTNKRLDSAMAKLQSAAEKMKAALTAIDAVKAEIEAEQKRVQSMLDRIDTVPLVKPVQRHGVAVTIKGHDGADDEVTANYATKPESQYGIHENVWSPRGIGDKKGSFSRPGGAERGKKIYEELHTSHGFTKSEAKILGSVATGEGDYHSLNSVDILRISLGFIQFGGSTFVKLLHDLKKSNPGYYQNQFAQYGILIVNPKKPDTFPTVTNRKDRHVPGEEQGHPVEQRSDGTKPWYKKLVVYDHSARVWVQGLEAMAVLQGDPRYMALIQESGRDVPMQLEQIKFAGRSFLRGVRKTQYTGKDIGLEEDPDTTFKIADIIRNEEAAYAVTAKGVGAGTSKGQKLAKSLFKALVKKYGLKTVQELKDLDQSKVAETMRELYDKWSRPTKLGAAIGSPLSTSSYSGTP